MKNVSYHTVISADRPFCWDVIETSIRIDGSQDQRVVGHADTEQEADMLVEEFSTQALATRQRGWQEELDMEELQDESELTRIITGTMEDACDDVFMQLEG